MSEYKITIKYIFVEANYFMSRSDLCSEQEITDLVHGFYGRIRVDPMLGPIFNTHISDWDTHLATMVRFWSSLLLGSGTYSGTPMPKHVALPDLSAEMFQHWLSLFEQTTSSLPNRRMADKTQEFAQRIARSLWFGYQMSNSPDRLPTELNHG